MNESEYTQRILECLRNDDFGFDSIELESHYNYYGDRGVVDLRTEQSNRIQLWELKADPAVENATGSNEIIRQFNRMKEYYFRDESNNDPGKHIEYILSFYPTEVTVGHVQQNLDSYLEIQESETDNLPRQTRVRNPEVVFHDGKTSVPVKQNIFESGDPFDGHYSAEHPVTSYWDENNWKDVVDEDLEG